MKLVPLFTFESLSEYLTNFILPVIKAQGFQISKQQDSYQISILKSSDKQTNQSEFIQVLNSALAGVFTENESLRKEILAHVISEISQTDDKLIKNLG
jgi:hypothetical protein